MQYNIWSKKWYSHHTAIELSYLILRYFFHIVAETHICSVSENWKIGVVLHINKQKYINDFFYHTLIVRVCLNYWNSWTKNYNNTNGNCFIKIWEKFPKTLILASLNGIFFSDLRPLTKIQKPFFSNFLFEKCRAASGVYYGF